MVEQAMQAGLIPRTIAKHFLVLLRAGPNYHPLETPEEKDRHNRHLAFQKSLYESGKLLIYGPTLDAHDDLRALGIMKVESADEARALFADDPHIRAGYLVMEIVTWMADSATWRER